MEIEGRIILELPVQEGTSKAGNFWKKGEWVLETKSTYPRKVKFTVFGEERLANLGHQLNVGADVVISVDVESREYNGRWYTDVSAYAVRPAAAGDGFGGPQTNGGGFGAPATPQAPAGFPPAPEFGPAPAAAPGLNQPFGPAPAAPAEGSSTDDLPF